LIFILFKEYLVNINNMSDNEENYSAEENDSEEEEEETSEKEEDSSDKEEEKPTSIKNIISKVDDSSDEEEEDEEDEDEEDDNENVEEDDVDEEIVSDDDDDDDDDNDNDENNTKSTAKKTVSSSSSSKIIKTPSLEQSDNSDSDEDDDDLEDNNYLQKFNSELNKNYILDYHPECSINNYDEILTLTNVVRDKQNNIIDELHKTLPYLTKYERARILGVRAKQINQGAKVFVKVPEKIIDGYIIAQLELEQKRIPFIIRRPIPGGGCEYWNLKDLEIIGF